MNLHISFFDYGMIIVHKSMKKDFGFWLKPFPHNILAILGQIHLRLRRFPEILQGQGRPRKAHILRGPNQPSHVCMCLHEPQGQGASVSTDLGFLRPLRHRCGAFNSCFVCFGKDHPVFWTVNFLHFVKIWWVIYIYQSYIVRTCPVCLGGYDVVFDVM